MLLKTLFVRAVGASPLPNAEASLPSPPQSIVEAVVRLLTQDNMLNAQADLPYLLVALHVDYIRRLTGVVVRINIIISNIYSMMPNALQQVCSVRT